MWCLSSLIYYMISHSSYCIEGTIECRSECIDTSQLSVEADFNSNDLETSVIFEYFRIHGNCLNCSYSLTVLLVYSLSISVKKYYFCSTHVCKSIYPIENMGKYGIVIWRGLGQGLSLVATPVSPRHRDRHENDRLTRVYRNCGASVGSVALVCRGVALFYRGVDLICRACAACCGLSVAAASWITDAEPQMQARSRVRLGLEALQRQFSTARVVDHAQPWQSAVTWTQRARYMHG